MANPWDENALLRHNQIIAGLDLTFSKLMVPELVRIIKGIDNYANLSLFEIGCGTGVLAHVVSQIVQRIVGIDSSEEACRIAREFTNDDKNVSIHTAKIEDLNLSYIESFDIALAHMVFQTIKDMGPVLLNIEKYLKLTGYFIFSIPHPCFYSFYKPEIGSSGYNYINQSNHVINFTISNDDSPLPSQIPYFHRPLSYYCNLLCEAGFLIETILEPFPDEKLLAEYSTAWNYPRYIILVCKKRFKREPL